MTLNINHDIKFKPTERGQKILENYEMYKYLRIDSEGMVTMLLWEFCQVFGAHFYTGADPVSEDNNIIII